MDRDRPSAPRPGVESGRWVQALGIRVKTANYHRSRIIEKLDIHGIAGLVR